MASLVDKVVLLAAGLDSATIPYAFGGALALAYATEEPRGTRDIDINVFVAPDGAARVFAALPAEVSFDDADVTTVVRDEQVRLWWDDTPIDLFFAADQFHHAAARRVRTVDFVGRTISVLAAEDLAVFKVLFDRSRDWVDIETMHDSGSLDVAAVITTVGELLGDGDSRIERLRHLAR